MRRVRETGSAAPDPGSRPDLLHADIGRFAPEVAGAADSRTVLEEIAALLVLSREEASLQDVMRILTRCPTEHSGVLVTSKDRFAELISREKLGLAHLRLLWGMIMPMAGASRWRSRRGVGADWLVAWIAAVRC